MKRISIVIPCYNEEVNVKQIYESIKSIFDELEGYSYEHIFIDNASVDNTPVILREIASEDPNVKVIFNSRNFGIVRSPYYGLLQATGDAAIIMACDFQDPPEMIPQFIRKWAEGYEIVIGVKNESKEASLMFMIRKLYYKLVNRLSDVHLFNNFTGFGLYDQRIIQILREIDDPYPYLRGLISEIGFDVATIPFIQPRRQRGITKNNFYTLYDLAMLGITSHSKIPLRIAAIIGFILSIVSLFMAFFYLFAKLLFWDRFTVGVATIIIPIFFFASVQLFFIGIIGEYIGAIHTQVLKRPQVLEKERINFDK